MRLFHIMHFQTLRQSGGTLQSHYHQKVLTLCAEIGEIESNQEAAQRFLTACQRLVGAEMVSIVGTQPLLGHLEPGVGIFQGLGEGEARLLQKDYFEERLYIGDPLNRAFRDRTAGHIAASRRCLVDDKSWYETAHFEVRQKLRIDDVATVTTPIPGGVAVLSLTRASNDRLFSADDLELLSFLNRIFGWLIRRMAQIGLVSAQPSRPPLPPRLERVLGQLLLGISEKAAAEAVGLSPRTTHKYIEQIYQFYQVTSRAELMALWIPRSESVAKSPNYWQLSSKPVR